MISALPDQPPSAGCALGLEALSAFGSPLKIYEFPRERFILSLSEDT